MTSSEPLFSTEPGAGTLGLRDWLKTAVGASVAAAEAGVASELLPDLFGYHILQVGDLYSRPLLQASRIGHQIVLDPMSHSPAAGLIARADALPVEACALDVVVLPHVLEFETDPHRVLREVERVLIADGHLLLFGFNPWSFYGLWRLATGWRGEAPWHGRFLEAGRVREWLAVLGFGIERAGRVSFRPPLRDERRFNTLLWLERMGRHYWPLAGNVYWLLARKQVLGMRPVRALRARRRRVRAAGVVGSRVNALPPEHREHPLSDET